MKGSDRAPTLLIWPIWPICQPTEHPQASEHPTHVAQVAGGRRQLPQPGQPVPGRRLLQVESQADDADEPRGLALWQQQGVRRREARDEGHPQLRGAQLLGHEFAAVSGVFCVCRGGGGVVGGVLRARTVSAAAGVDCRQTPARQRQPAAGRSRRLLQADGLWRARKRAREDEAGAADVPRLDGPVFSYRYLKGRFAGCCMRILLLNQEGCASVCMQKPEPSPHLTISSPQGSCARSSGSASSPPPTAAAAPKDSAGWAQVTTTLRQSRARRNVHALACGHEAVCCSPPLVRGRRRK
jgi:hypothetical protein